MKKLLAFTLLSFVLQTASAQKTAGSSSYKTAVGIRGGGTSGLTIKHFNSSSSAIEGIIGFGGNWNKRLSLTCLMEKHTNPFKENGLNLYYGIGAHLANYRNGFYADGFYGKNKYNYVYYNESVFGIGVDGIIGIEYKIQPIPVAVSFDLKPFLEINTHGYAGIALDPGLGIKFTF